MDPTELVEATPEKNWREALHVAGSSPLKGTSLVIDAWTRNPEWPLLNLVTSIGSHVSRASRAPNIRLWTSRLAAHELAVLQLRCGVHVQPSETDGYGHVLGESLAAGAAVVSVDAAPMNELVQDSRGYLVRCRPTTMHCLARRYEIVPEHFDQTLNAIWGTAIERLQDKGRSAREWYLANRTTFQGRLRELLTAAATGARSEPH
jgi:glycosyltransferase involved in cell wall biosynthesis